MPKLISDLAIMLLTAGIVAIVFKRLKQPLVLGYILAGFLVGPYLPYFFTVADGGSIETWSEIGIIVLMFGLGLEFNLHKLVRVGGSAVITALTEVSGMLLVGYLTGQALGWGTMDSVFLGGMLSMSSTTIIIKAFDELGVRKKGFAQMVFGTLVIEDIAGIFMMIILSTVSVSKSISGLDLALKLGLLVLYLALWLVLGIYILPSLLRRASAFMNDETLLLTSLGICFGMVLLAEELGFSSALGAFLAGSLLAGTVHAERVEHLTAGIKDLFGSVFFLSVGMMINPAMLVKYALPILVVTLVTIVGKLLISTLGVLLAGQGLKTAVHCGSSLAQIGEFAFIIASLGMSLGVIAPQLYPIVVAVSVITTLTTPTLIKSSDGLYRLLCRLLPDGLIRRLERSDADDVRTIQDSDWGSYLSRYAKITLFYGALMGGVVLLSRYLLFPWLRETALDQRLSRWACAAVCVAGIALFVRPMLDLHSTRYTTLWVKDRRNRLPLISLAALRFFLIVLLLFFSLHQLLQISALWLLPLIAVAVWLIYKSGWMSSAYLSAATRFMANLNERALHGRDQSDTEWLDEKLLVQEFTCDETLSGRTLRQLNWGFLFSVNVIKVVRGRKHLNMPSGTLVLRQGDRIFLLGQAEDLRSMQIHLGLERQAALPTLRSFIAGQAETAESEPDNLYACAVPVSRASLLQGISIRTSGLRENYDCMILGIQRQKLPILQPDVNMILQADDLVWVLGSRHMAEKLMAGHLKDL